MAIDEAADNVKYIRKAIWDVVMQGWARAPWDIYGDEEEFMAPLMAKMLPHLNHPPLDCCVRKMVRGFSKPYANSSTLRPSQEEAR